MHLTDMQLLLSAAMVSIRDARGEKKKHPHTFFLIVAAKTEW